MPIQLLDTLSASLGYNKLKKVDPNTLDIPDKHLASSDDLFAQAAFPSIFMAFYRYTLSDSNANELLRTAPTDKDWAASIFAGFEEQLEQTIANYAQMDSLAVKRKIKMAASNASNQLRTALTGKTIHDLKELMLTKRQAILVYLPGAVRLGELLKDDALDDRTQKMEGPISSFMHKMSDSVFSKPSTDDEIADKKKNF